MIINAIAVGTRGIALTKGKTYTVKTSPCIHYYGISYTSPTYGQVTDNNGKTISLHLSRFTTLDHKDISVPYVIEI